MTVVRHFFQRVFYPFLAHPGLRQFEVLSGQKLPGGRRWVVRKFYLKFKWGAIELLQNWLMWHTSAFIVTVDCALSLIGFLANVAVVYVTWQSNPTISSKIVAEGLAGLSLCMCWNVFSSWLTKINIELEMLAQKLHRRHFWLQEMDSDYLFHFTDAGKREGAD